MRVRHVISGIDPKNGGPTTALMGLTKAQVQLGLDVSVVATWQFTAGRDNAENFRRNGVRVEMIGPARGKLSRHPDLKTAVASAVAAADVVHIHALFEEIQHQAAAAGRRLGVPYIMRPCGGLDPWALSRGWLKKRLYLAWRLRRDLDAAAAIHYTTAAERDAAAALRLKPPAIIEPNGIDLSEFTDLPPRGELRRRFPQIGDRRIVLFLGRLHEKKGLDILLPAFAAANVPDAVLVLAGPMTDGYDATVRQLIAEHALHDRVVLTGMLTGRQRIEALVDAEIFVLSSYVENFGIAVIESLAAGTPVIISDRVNLAEQIRPHGVGEVLPLEVKSFGGSIGRWLKDQPLRDGAAARARPFALQNFDWREIATRWSGHYERLVEVTRSIATGAHYV
jgi:glycosyltransferase involved in cell wall biosynthesis